MARWVVDRTRAAARREGGFSLIELVVAITIFGVVMLGLALTIGSGLALTRTNRHRTVAANLAAQEMDAIRSAEFATIVPGTKTQDVEGITYTIHRETTWVARDATSGPCDGSGDTPEVLRVRVRVEWPNMRGVQPVVSDTTLTPPVGSYDPDTGHVGVKVLDADASPVFNVPVQLSGPSSSTLTTNSDGCAFFAFLPEGTYTVALGTPGWVDRQSNATPSQTVGVTIGNVSSVQFDYDRAATLAVTLVGEAGAPIPADLSVTVANPQLVPNGTQELHGHRDRPARSATCSPSSTATRPGPAAARTPIPRARSSELDGGGNPVVLGPYWPGATREPVFAVQSGSTTSVSVPLRALDVVVLDSLSLPVAGATVRVVHGADDACSGEEHVVGTTDATGHVRASLPYGTWEVQVDGRVPAGAWPDAVLDPRTPGPVAVTAGVAP
ncbi:MAG: hypothetical protein KatS3mg009_2474 [Acidimicrobiia bacterium]|nr:MAG: hypothetical protein KatS3mg009_2474 [Acidimicrobiia bacterium]